MSTTEQFNEHDAAIERWRREGVVAGRAEYLADPSKGVPAGEILARIEARRSANGRHEDETNHRARR